MPKLVREGSAEGIEISGEGVVVGRERGCDVILRSKSVSRRHARLLIREGMIWVQDLDSANGTRINGHKVDVVSVVRLGDVVTFGDLNYTLANDTAAADPLADSHVVNAIFARDSVCLPDPEPKQTPTSPRIPEPPLPRRAELVSPPPAKVKSVQKAELQVSKPRRRVPRDESQSQDVYLRTVCASILVGSLILGFVAGKCAKGLAAINLPGEQTALSNLELLPPRPIEVVPEPPIAAAEMNSSSGAASTAVNATSSQSSRAATDSPAVPGLNPAVGSSVPAPSGVTASDPLAEKEAAGGDMSDSVKTIKLMKEMKQAGIDVGDTEAIEQIAREKLGMPPDQIKRIMRFLNSVAERNALLEGRFNDSPKPKRANVVGNSASEKKSAPEKSQKTSQNLLQASSQNSSTTNAVSQPTVSTPGDSPSNSNVTGSDSAQATPKTNKTDPTEGLETASQATAVETVAAAPRPMLAVRRGPGYYFNMWGLLLIAGLFSAWFFNLDWLFRDIRELGFADTFWAPLLGASGPVGAVLALLTPDLGWGAMLDSACLSAPLLAYIATRDEQLPTRRRLLWFVPSSDDADSKPASPLFEKVDVAFFPYQGVKHQSGVADDAQDDSTPESRLAKSLFATAVARRASEVLLEYGREEYRVKLRIDGTQRPADSYPAEIAEGLPQFFRSLGRDGTAASEAISPDRFRARVNNEIMDVRAFPDEQQLVLKLFRRNDDLDNLSGLGCHRKMQGELREIITQSQGVFLVCGPAASGKSTTLRAVLGELDASEIRIVSIENPIERRIEGVTQIELNARLNQTYSSALQSVWTDDPDVVMIGDVEDQATAAAIAGKASQIHLVVASVAARDTAGAIQKMIELGAAPADLSDRLLAVLSQNLVRRLCPECKVQYRPDAELLRRSRIPFDHDMVLCRPPQKGSQCAACEGTGYRGRTGIFELLKVDEAIRGLIQTGADPSQIRSAARRQRMMTIRESGLRLAIRGVTALDEVNKVTRE